jgi:hypothetical protein
VKKNLPVLIILASIAFASCQKEISSQAPGQANTGASGDSILVRIEQTDPYNQSADIFTIDYDSQTRVKKLTYSRYDSATNIESVEDYIDLVRNAQGQIVIAYNVTPHMLPPLDSVVRHYVYNNGSCIYSYIDPLRPLSPPNTSADMSDDSSIFVYDGTGALLEDHQFNYDSLAFNYVFVGGNKYVRDANNNVLISSSLTNTPDEIYRSQYDNKPAPIVISNIDLPALAAWFPGSDGSRNNPITIRYDDNIHSSWSVQTNNYIFGNDNLPKLINESTEYHSAGQPVDTEFSTTRFVYRKR